MPDPTSPDPRRRVDPAPSPEAPSTVDDTGAYQPADSTGLYTPAPLAGAPSIPDYRITAEIGRGGMGRVYAGHDLTLDREVAIKTLLPGADAERFVTEAKITARLPHPAIPPVHALGRLADGTPYLAMKLIRGRTLADLLDKRPSPLDELPRFVQIFEQVAQAVGFAHAHGIFHRDLKPLNIMVGALGEVQVMDWGLAKELKDEGGRMNDEESQANSSDSSFILHPPSLLTGDRTQVGSVLGTPGYMAPEQARGEAVDARADVFALGATLAAILTGQPAFVGASKREVIDSAARADLADVRKRLTNSGADCELIALALSCLSADVAERPVDGRAVAALVAAYRAGVEARLKQAETQRAEALVREAEQRKRRRTVQVAGGVIAVVLLTGLTVSLWQMFRAIDAEGQANQNARQARTERDAKDAALQAEQQARQDETKARRQAFAALRSMTVEVLERKFAQGTVLTEDDRTFLRGVIAQFDAFAAIKGDDAGSRAVRAEGRLRVGNMRYTLAERQEAEKDYDEALGIYKQLAAEFPSRAEYREGLADTHNNRGNLRNAAGRLKEAEQDFDEALRIRQHLVADLPTEPAFRQDLAKSYNNRGNLLNATGRLKEADKDFDEALRIQKRLAADVPARPEFRQDLARSLNNRGILLRAVGRLPEAGKDCEQALSICKRLAADDPNRPEFRQDLALSYVNRGNLLRDTGRPQEAETDYDQALRIQKQLAAEFPARPEFRQELAVSHNNRGNLLRDTGRPRDAEEAYDQALSIQKQLAADIPTRPEFRQELARTLINRGNLLNVTGRLQEAEKDYDQALSIQKQLAADFPTRPEFREDLTKTHNNRGSLLRATGRFQEAERDYDQALSIRKQLAADFPSRTEFRQDLASSYNNRGLLLSYTGRPQEAEKDYQQALNIYQQLAAELPNQPDLRSTLAGTCVNLAVLHQQQGDWAVAKRLLLEGRPHHLAALRANPRHPTYRQFYRNHLGVLSQVHAALLEQEDAVRTALTRRDLGWNAPADAYDAACFLSRCIPIVANHDELDDGQRKAAARFYGDAALRLLRDAVGKGYRDVTHMKEDTALAPLRQRDDFQKLVAALEGMGK
jgi:serine/threonine protein kinase/predicted RNA polymerase sigma factor